MPKDQDPFDHYSPSGRRPPWLRTTILPGHRPALADRAELLRVWDQLPPDKQKLALLLVREMLGPKPVNEPIKLRP